MTRKKRTKEDNISKVILENIVRNKSDKPKNKKLIDSAFFHDSYIVSVDLVNWNKLRMLFNIIWPPNPIDKGYYTLTFYNIIHFSYEHILGIHDDFKPSAIPIINVDSRIQQNCDQITLSVNDFSPSKDYIHISFESDFIGGIINNKENALQIICEDFDMRKINSKNDLNIWSHKFDINEFWNEYMKRF